MKPVVSVEARFGGSWVDISGYVQIESGSEIVITRGRASEVDTTQPGTCAVTLRNDAGEFTPGYSGSPFYPWVETFTPLRVKVAQPSLDGGDAWATHDETATGGAAVASAGDVMVAGGVAVDVPAWRERFYGFVEAWPVAWRGAQGLVSLVRVTAVDLLGLAGLQALRSYAANRILGWSPVAYYPLSEDSSSTRADDISGHDQPQLNKTQVGADGTFEFGNTDALPAPLESEGMALATRASATAGIYLLSAAALTTFGTSFTVVILAKPSASGYIWQIKQGTFVIGLYWASATSKYSVRQYNGSVWSTLVTSSAAHTELYCEVVTVTATTVTLRSDATRTATARAAATFSSPTVYIGYCSDSTSGFDDLPTAQMGHLAIIGSALTMATNGEADTLAAQLTTPATSFTQYADELLQDALGWAGFAGETVSYLGPRTQLGFVACSGETVSSLGDKLARGTLGRAVVTTAGQLQWVSPEYSPAIVELDATDATPDYEWVADKSTYVTDAKTSLPSGGSYTYSSTTPGRIRASRDIVGVLPSDAKCKDLVRFIVSGSSLDPRIPNAGFDLLGLPDVTAEELLDLDLGAVFSLSGLPSQIPDNQVLVIEGAREVVGAKVFAVEFNTSPSSRILPPDGWHFITLDDAVFGTLNTATNILAAT